MTENSTLQSQISEMQKGMAGKMPPETIAIFQQATAKLIESGIAQKALQKDAQAPAFTLPNAKGETISSAELLKKGPLVINFYRGGWCPYCNLELAALQKVLPQIQAAGATLVAISPEMPDKSLSTTEKNNLTFEILSDQGNKVARKFGLVFELAAELRPIYAQMKLDLPAYNGNTSWTLPIPATYIIDQNGKIIYSFVQADYTQRSEPEKIVEILGKQLNQI